MLARYTLDPFNPINAGSSGCAKIHLAGALLDPRAKDLVRVPPHIKKKAIRVVECIGGQLIADKLAEEFGGDGDTTSEVDTPDQTAEGAGNDAGAAPGAEDAPKKSILAQVWQLSDDEMGEVHMSARIYIFYLALPSPSLCSPTSSRQVRLSAAYFAPTPDPSRRP